MSPKPISVLITGSNRGLGLEMVTQILETQRPLSMLFACCRDPAKAEELQALARRHPNIIKIIQMDCVDPASIKQAAAQVGSLLGQSGLNLIINNAAIAVYTPALESTPEDMLNCYKTNTVGPMCVIQEFLPHLQTAAKHSGMLGMSCRKAAVVNISTTASSIGEAKVSYQSFSALPYRASKAALNMMTVCASVDLQKEEILCTLLHPGWVLTEMGGSEAEIGVEESVQGMLHVMNSMTDQHHGALVDYKGQTIPW